MSKYSRKLTKRQVEVLGEIIQVNELRIDYFQRLHAGTASYGDYVPSRELEFGGWCKRYPRRCVEALAGAGFVYTNDAGEAGTDSFELCLSPPLDLDSIDMPQALRTRYLAIVEHYREEQ